MIHKSIIASTKMKRVPTQIIPSATLYGPATAVTYGAIHGLAFHLSRDGRVWSLVPLSEKWVDSDVFFPEGAIINKLVLLTGCTFYSLGFRVKDKKCLRISEHLHKMYFLIIKHGLDRDKDHINKSSGNWSLCINRHVIISWITWV